MKIGICTKCRKHGKVVMHHAHGYLDEHKDDVLPYCPSCHKKIHIQARKEGRCPFTPNELKKMSWNSSHRRRAKEQCKYIQFNETMLPNVQLFENILVWPSRIQFSSYFHIRHGKLYYIDDDKHTQQ